MGCYATGNAEGSYIGGLAGFNEYTIFACYATGNVTNVTAEVDGGRVGGLVGSNRSSGTIRACYAAGSATGAEGGHTGGLVGHNSGSTISSDSYFDTDLSTATQGVGAGTIITGLGKTTAELQGPLAYGTGIYTAWNIDVDDADNDDDVATGVDDPWDFGSNVQYPALKVDFDGNSSATAYEFGGQGRSAPTLAVAPAAPTGFFCGQSYNE